MRILWPTTAKIPPGGGIAIGWRKGQDGDVLRVAAVVPAWRDEFSLINSHLTILASVQDVSRLSDPQYSSPDSGPTIYLQEGVPAALSFGPAHVVLYAPASSVADLLIYESDSAEEDGRSPPPDDGIMDAFVQSTNIQRFIFQDTIPKRRSWVWLADVPRNLVLIANAAPKVFGPMARDRKATFSRGGASRLPRLTWRTAEEFKTATKLPLPRVRRHGFGYRPDLSHQGGESWRDLTLQQVLPIFFVLLYIFRRYWLPLVWQAALAVVVIVGWVIYEMGIGVLKGLLMLSGRLDFVNAAFRQIWHFLANARQWSAAVDAVCFTWSLAAALEGVREDSLLYKQNVLRLQVENNIGPIIGGILLRVPPMYFSFSVILVDPVIAAIDWLNSWPVGFKLNTELSNFMSSTLKAALDLWKDWVFSRLPILYVFVFLVVGSIAGSLGFLSNALDAFRLITLHLRAGYMFTRALYRWQMSALGGLWNLFRGKRWNTLRHRTDSHAYDLDTLFLGTLLFTLSVFLAPTLVAYYGLFAMINAALVAVEGGLRLGIVVAKTCPWYELQLRFRFPDALPGGVVFEPVPLPNIQATDVFPVQQMLKAEITPKSYGEILAPMRKDLGRTLGSLKSRL